MESSNKSIHFRSSQQVSLTGSVMNQLANVRDNSIIERTAERNSGTDYSNRES